MTTLNEMIAIIKSENSEGIRVGDDKQGYTSLNAKDYEATITAWANARLAKEAKVAEAEAIIEAKKQAVIKLTELGIDPKAFDLQTALSTPMIPGNE
jgi:hypothetical protein